MSILLEFRNYQMTKLPLKNSPLNKRRNLIKIELNTQMFIFLKIIGSKIIEYIYIQIKRDQR